MCYNILTQTGEIISRFSVQPLTELEKQTDEYKSMFEKYDKAISEKMGDKKEFKGDKVNVEDWGDFASDPIFVEEFQKFTIIQIFLRRIMLKGTFWKILISIWNYHSQEEKKRILICKGNQKTKGCKWHPNLYFT